MVLGSLGVIIATLVVLGKQAKAAPVIIPDELGTGEMVEFSITLTNFPIPILGWHSGFKTEDGTWVTGRREPDDIVLLTAPSRSGYLIADLIAMDTELIAHYHSNNFIPMAGYAYEYDVTTGRVEVIEDCPHTLAIY